MDVVELTKKLVAIDSQNTNTNEKEVVDFIENIMKDLGLETFRQKIGDRENLIGIPKGSTPKIALFGHMDTVPIGNMKSWTKDPFGEVVDEKLYGRGTADMKGGIACALVAAEEALDAGVNTFVLAFTADEEVGLSGARYLVEEKEKYLSGVRFGVVGECSGFGDGIKIVTAHKGVIHGKMLFKGKAAHGSKPELGENAVYKAIEAVQRILEDIDKVADVKTHPILGKPTVNIGKIVGGTKANIVPDYCEIEIDRRVVPGEDVKEVENLYVEIAHACGGEFEIKVSMPSLEVPENSDAVLVAKDVFKKLGLDTKLYGKTGYTEAEIYTRLGGVPTLNIGPGILEQAHTADEFVLIENLKKSVEIYRDLILASGKKWG